MTIHHTWQSSCDSWHACYMQRTNERRWKHCLRCLCCDSKFWSVTDVSSASNNRSAVGGSLLYDALFSSSSVSTTVFGVLLRVWNAKHRAILRNTKTGSSLGSTRSADIVKESAIFDRQFKSRWLTFSTHKNNIQRNTHQTPMTLAREIIITFAHLCCRPLTVATLFHGKSRQFTWKGAPSVAQVAPLT